MLEAIINFLNLKLELLNYFEQQHCLCELKSDNEGKVAPVEYVGESNYTVISHDEFDGVSYWRLRDKPTQDVLETKYQAGKRVEVKIPLRLVFSVRRTKLTTDDAYAFDRIRQTIVKQFNFDDGILKTTLGAESVVVSVPTSNGDARNVWDEETSETGTYEPNYSFVYGSIDIEVAVIYKGSCLPTECDDVDSNILHAFDFCKPSVVAQLTPTQVACLEADLCIPLCDQLAEVLPEDVVIDVFDCLSEAAQTELLDSECVIPPCADATVEINSTLFDTVASGATIDIPVINGGSNTVGSLQGSDWVIGNNMTTINGTQVTDQEAEVNAAIFATLDGSQSGSWNAGTQTWEMTSAACDDATVTINGASLGATGTIPSGGSEDLDVLQGGVATGSWNGSAWIIPTCPVVPSLSVGLSTSTPNYGDSVTITATPSGITPTSYTFIVPKDDGDYVKITQASNVYVWTAVYTGALKIIVEATDGTLFAVGEASVTVTWAFGNCISLNGTTQHVETIASNGADILCGNKFCLSFWVYVSSYSNTPIVVGKGVFWVWLLSTTSFRLSNGRSFTVSMATGQWHHVLINNTNAGGTNWEVYINGSAIGGGSGSTSVPTNTQEQILLGRYQSAGFNLNGRMDETMAFVGYNPSAAQVLAYYNSGNGSHPSVLGKMPDWRIDYNSNVLDQSGNGRNCQLVNSPTYIAH